MPIAHAPVFYPIVSFLGLVQFRVGGSDVFPALHPVFQGAQEAFLTTLRLGAGMV